MSGKDIRVYEDWNEIDAFGNEVSVHNPVSYANTPDGFSDDPKQLYQSSAGEDVAYEIGQLDQWQDDPAGVDFRLGQVVQAVAVMRDLDGWERNGLIAGFEALPWDARDAIFNELSLGDASADRLPTAFEAAWFSSVVSFDAETQLRSHWRGRFERNIQKIARRTRRIMKNMSPRDRASADVWFDGLSDRQAVAACIALAT